MVNERRLYVLRTDLEGFRRNSAEMDMLNEVVEMTARRGKDIQAYLDSAYGNDQHNLLRRYCINNRIKLKEVFSLGVFAEELLAQTAANYALITRRKTDELKRVLDTLRESGIDIEVRERQTNFRQFS